MYYGYSIGRKKSHEHTNKRHEKINEIKKKKKTKIKNEQRDTKKKNKVREMPTQIVRDRSKRSEKISLNLLEPELFF